MSIQMLYALCLSIGLFSFCVGMIIRGILAEKEQDEFRKRIIENHSAAMVVLNGLNKDLKNETEARRTAEKIIKQLRLDVESVKAHGSRVQAGGDPGITEQLGLKKEVFEVIDTEKIVA
jgi:hypothetical protein